MKGLPHSLSAALLAALLCASVGCGSGRIDRDRIEWPAMGTVAAVQTRGARLERDKTSAAAVAKAAAGRESLQALKTQLNSYNEFYNGVVDYADGVDKASGGAKQIFDGSAELKSGTGELAYGTSKLKSGTGQLSSGASQLKGGTSDLKNGTSQLSSGASTLSSGASQLFDGIGTLKNGSSSLLDGVKQLKDGAMKLDDGLKKFKKEGVDVIVKAVDGDVKPLIERFKAMVQVSKNYKSFSGTTDEMDGKVNFIFKTDSIKPEDSYE